MANRRTTEVGLSVGDLERGPRKGLPRLWWQTAIRDARQARVVHRQPPLRSFKPPRPFGRRSMVKASFRRNTYKGAWVKHARYLSRDGAQREDGRGLGFNATEHEIDMPATVREWEKTDQLLWSIIVSPEDGSALNLREHARALMVEMERDLNTPLQWMGVDHHNTERDHVHILVRGVRDDGRVLLIDRQYISKGIRQRSQEIVERELGQRTEQEYLRTRGDAVQRDYWTEIDGALKKRAGEGRLVDYESYVPYNTAAQMKAEQEIDRLIFLERQGLARQTKEMQWELDADFEKALHDRTQEREAQLFRRNWKSREQVQEIER